MNNEISKWVEESEEHRKAYFEEGLILGVTEEIWKVLSLRGISKVELADRLGKSKGFVSQVLNGSRNMTLRTLADIAYALGFGVSFKLEYPELKAENLSESKTLSLRFCAETKNQIGKFDISEFTWIEDNDASYNYATESIAA